MLRPTLAGSSERQEGKSVSKAANIYNVLIVVGPPLIVAAISWLSMRMSYDKQRSDHNKDLRLSKIETWYEALVKINGGILAEISRFQSDKEYYVERGHISRTVEQIESLKVQSKLYLGFEGIDEYRIRAERLLKTLSLEKAPSTSERERFFKSEYETDESTGQHFRTVPSAFDLVSDPYDEAYFGLEDTIVSLARTEIGNNAGRRKTNRRKRARKENQKR
jgi:hypothetical protein